MGEGGFAASSSCYVGRWVDYWNFGVWMLVGFFKNGECMFLCDVHIHLLHILKHTYMPANTDILITICVYG